MPPPEIQATNLTAPDSYRGWTDYCGLKSDDTLESLNPIRLALFQTMVRTFDGAA